MKYLVNLLLASSLALSATASPAPDCPTNSGSPNNSSITAAKIEAIAPSTKSCQEAEFPEECANASVAAPAISTSFTKYDIQSTGEQAALIALMLFESGNFTFNKNHFPGVAGQGTKNMQSPEFNTKYATDLFGEEAVQEAKASGGAEAVLELVSGNEESFGSAAWFLTTQCDAKFKQGLADETKDGWDAYLTDCIGTTADPARNPPWERALEVLGGKGV